MSDLAPIIRIILYIVSGWLVSKGLPPKAAEILTSDPAVVELASQALGAVVVALTLIWWRLAKRFGWST